MIVRRTQEEDIAKVLEVYQAGRQFQRQVLKLWQWEDHYPNEAQLREDISAAGSYMVLEENSGQGSEILATFFVQEGPDQIYLPLKSHWQDLDQIVTIHRLASNGRQKGMGKFIFNWLQSQFNYIMIDTHDHNHVMKKLLADFNFRNIGQVTIANGTLRNVYEYQTDM